MKVTVKLFALLGKYLPTGTKGNEASIEVEGGATPISVLNGLGVPLEHCHLILINGTYVEPSERNKVVLIDGDALAVWPPVAGG